MRVGIFSTDKPLRRIAVKRQKYQSCFLDMTTMGAAATAGVLMILGFIMAIVGNYNMWWGADSMIGIWGAIGIIGLFILIAGSVMLNSARNR